MILSIVLCLEYGQEYYKYPDKIVDLSTKQRTIDKTILTNPPQKDFKLVGAVEFPPTAIVPLFNQGYIVMLAQ